MKKSKSNSKGSTLVILLITTSVIILIGTAVLYLATTNYKMKKLNSDVKRAFYLAEAGIDEAYIIIKEFINDALNYAEEKATVGETQNLNSIYSNEFKNYIKGECKENTSNKGLINALNDNKSYEIYKDGYPEVNAIMNEYNNGFLIEIQSIYAKDKIKRIIVMKCTVDVPQNFHSNLYNNASYEHIIKIVHWKVER